MPFARELVMKLPVFYLPKPERQPIEPKNINPKEITKNE